MRPWRVWLVSNVSLGLALGSSIAIGAGEAGERVYTCRDCVPHYLQYKFKFIIISFLVFAIMFVLHLF